MLGVPEDHACEFEVILIVRHNPLLSAWSSVAKISGSWARRNAVPVLRDRGRRRYTVHPIG
jgi:hypothetical protein